MKEEEDEVTLLMFSLLFCLSFSIVLSVRMTCYASLLNLLKVHAYTHTHTCTHTQSHSVSQQRDGWMDGSLGRPIFFFLLLFVGGVDTLRWQHKGSCSKWCGITRSLFSLLCRRTNRNRHPIYLFFFLKTTDSASLHVWKNPPSHSVCPSNPANNSKRK